MEDDELREFADLARNAHTEDELNMATLHVTDRHGNDITPIPAKKKFRELKLRGVLKKIFLQKILFKITRRRKK